MAVNAVLQKEVTTADLPGYINQYLKTGVPL
jgi:hypothetical protein